MESDGSPGGPGSKESKDSRLTEYFERLWSQALVKASTAEEEASKILTKLGEVAGLGQDELKRQVRELADRLASQRREMEKNIDEAVRSAMSRLRVPTRDDLQSLNSSLDRVAARLEALEQEVGKGDGRPM